MFNVYTRVQHLGFKIGAFRFPAAQVSGADGAGGKFGTAEYTLTVGRSMGEKL